MMQSELKKKLEALISEYFGGATVTWGKTKGVSPNVPQVVLIMGGISRHYHPINQSVGGVTVNSYPSRTTLQVDLYTKGEATNTAPGMMAAYENTAVNDITDFLNFINSEYVGDWCEINDVSILCNHVNDLTELINDTTWDYRAMVEMEIGFMQSAVGSTGIMYEDGVPHYENGNPKYDRETGMPLYENGRPMYDLDGMPLFDNGQPMYDAEGRPLDRHGNLLPDGVPVQLPPLPPPVVDDHGDPIIPESQPTSSGGRTPALAGSSTGWFEKVDDPELIKEE